MKRMFCILFVVLFCACVPTPEKEFIISKEDNLAEQKIHAAPLTEDTVSVPQSSANAPIGDGANGTPAKDSERTAKAQTFPTRWDEEAFLIREYVTLAIHADVETKADGLYPVVETRNETMSNETVIALLGQLLKQPVSMQYLDARTKEEWGRELKEYVDTVADWQAWVDAGRPEIEGHDDTDFTPEEIEATTAWYMEQIQNAPDRIETKKVSDYRSYHINETVSYTLEDGGYASVTACNDKPWRNYLQISDGCKSCGYIYYAYRHEECSKEGADAAMKRTAALWKETTLSREDAEAIAYREIERLGFSDFRIAYGEKAILLDVREGAADRFVATGWGFRLNRDYGGYPMIDVRFEPSHLLNYGDDDAFAVNEPIREEQIEVFVDENGIRFFAYSNPKAVTGLLNANVELLPFSEIQRIVKNTLSVCYPVQRYQGSADWQWSLEVYRVVLTTYTLHKRDADGFYEMPCWIVLFDGWQGRERDTQSMRMQSIIINAVDGTVVHSAQGY